MEKFITKAKVVIGVVATALAAFVAIAIAITSKRADEVEEKITEKLEKEDKVIETAKKKKSKVEAEITKDIEAGKEIISSEIKENTQEELYSKLKKVKTRSKKA